MIKRFKRYYPDEFAKLTCVISKYSNEAKNFMAEIEVSKISSVYETLPVGGPEQGNYLNAVISLNTELEADELLLKLLLIELNLGRQREIAWGPRTIDLDLIWFEGQTINLENTGSGVYFVNIKTDNGLLITKKIVME